MTTGPNPGHSSQSGKFITFEGGEGTGKTTQIARLCAALEATGVTVVQTREPGGCSQAETIRELLVTGEPGKWKPLTETLLHFAARNEHLDRVIRPALSQGKWVVSDRFSDSTMAYQGYVQGIGQGVVQDLEALIVQKTRPDLTIILDLPSDVGLKRAGSREDTEERYEKMGDAFHAKLKDAFLDIAEQNKERCVVVDASGSINEVEARIRRAVEDRLGLSLGESS